MKEWRCGVGVANRLHNEPVLFKQYSMLLGILDAFPSCRLCAHIWFLGSSSPDSTETLPLDPAGRLSFPDHLCSLYIQTLTMLLFCNVYTLLIDCD